MCAGADPHCADAHPYQAWRVCPALGGGRRRGGRQSFAPTDASYDLCGGPVFVDRSPWPLGKVTAKTAQVQGFQEDFGPHQV